MRAHMTDKAIQETEARFAAEHRALAIFKLVVAEWQSDSTSVQCFDLRLVEEAKRIDAQLRRLSVFY